jgi:predicted Kef-type K+ transport protein
MKLMLIRFSSKVISVFSLILAVFTIHTHFVSDSLNHLMVGVSLLFVWLSSFLIYMFAEQEIRLRDDLDTRQTVVRCVVYRIFRLAT